MKRCGLLGERLGHSYSPAIHAMLGDYEYRLYECPRDKLGDFLEARDFDGLNVTIPYKKAVLPYCAELSPMAAAIGSVNTLLRRPDGSLYGDNTDAFGFESLLRHAGLDPAGRKCLVLGSGGASATVQAVLRQLGAGSVTVISRGGEDNYGNLSRHRDAELLVNTTPVGMYPGNGLAPVDLTAFPGCRGVVDLIYNPARTALLLQAGRLGIPCAGGLWMLAAQAKRASELFTGSAIPDDVIPRVTAALRRETENVILIGMPGSGKTTVAMALAEKLRRPVLDSDAAVAETAGIPIPAIFEREGEAGFRRRETAALAELGKRGGIILATGGGSVTRPENYDLLRQNGTILWLQRDITKLPTDGRPISQSRDLSGLLRERTPAYTRFADYIIDNNGTVEETLCRILEVLP